MSTALLQVRVDRDLKNRVDKRLKRMGLTTSAAVNMLMHQIDIQHKIPFDIVDEDETHESLANTIRKEKAGIGLSKVYDDPIEFYHDLGITDDELPKDLRAEEAPHVNA